MGVDPAGHSSRSATNQHPSPSLSASASTLTSTHIRLTHSSRLTCTQHQLPSTLHVAHLSFGAAPSWARIVQGRMCPSVLPQPQPMAAATRDDFFALYKRSRLGAHVGICHSSGLQDIYISCRLLSPFLASIAPIAKHNRCHQRCVHAATVTTPPSPPPAPHLALSLTPSNTLPAKCPRRAVKR
jgi:hypothetical protein